MNSQTTLGDLREAYYQIINPADANDPDFLLAVNKALQRMVEGGEWVGSHVEVVFNGSMGYITLPPHYMSIIGVTVNKVPMPVYSDFHQYCEFGPGTFDASLPFGRFLSRAAEDVPTVIDLTAGQILHFRPAIAADAGKIIRCFGDDTNNNPIFDVTVGNEGIPLGILSPLAVMSTPLNRFTGFQKPATLGRLNVYGYDGVTETLLSQYQPNETRPAYARYMTGTLDSNLNIGCLCRRRHLPVYVDTDFLPIGNFAAWEQALNAVKFNNIEQFEKSDKQWSSCFSLLNREHMAMRGKARPELSLVGPGSWNRAVKVN